MVVVDDNVVVVTVIVGGADNSFSFMLAKFFPVLRGLTNEAVSSSPVMLSTKW